MDERVSRRSFCLLIVLVLPVLFMLGVLPCAAEQTYNLQELIDEQTVIRIDNVSFSGFTLDDQNTFAIPQVEENVPKPSDITVVPRGHGTSTPRLEFIPSFQLSAQTFSLKIIGFLYEVTADTSSPLIKGSGLVLNPGTVEAAGAYAKAMVEDKRDPNNTSDDLAVVRKVEELDSSGVYALVDTLRAEAKFVPQTTVSPHIVVALTVDSPGGEASIQSFEHIVSLVPVEGRPVADAGPYPSPVFDTVELDGSGSVGNIASYKWELVPREETLEKLTADGMKPLVEGLGKSFYDVTLTVTDENGLSHADTAVVAAAGPCEAKVPEPDPATLGDLHLWRFKLKKYKYCNWSIARMVGSFSWPEEFKTDNGDCLTGEVTIKVTKDGELMGVWSDEIRIKAKKRRHKVVLQNY